MLVPILALLSSNILINRRHAERKSATSLITSHEYTNHGGMRDRSIGVQVSLRDASRYGKYVVLPTAVSTSSTSSRCHGAFIFLVSVYKSEVAHVPCTRSCNLFWSAWEQYFPLPMNTALNSALSISRGSIVKINTSGSLTAIACSSNSLQHAMVMRHLCAASRHGHHS